MRLVKAAIKRFSDYCETNGITLPKQNFAIRYDSTIPRQVGLAGSSAIITATMRGLCSFYGVEIPKQVLPSLVLSVETDEIGIAAGLQDRVTQTYEGLVYMDFDREYMAVNGYGIYENLNTSLLPPLYLAYQLELAESSDVFHSNIRQRYDRGEAEVVGAMNRFGDLARDGRERLLARDHNGFAQLMNLNFDTRRLIYNLNPRHIRMIDLARSLGASAHFAGSGGSIIGVYDDEAMFRSLKKAFEAERCAVIKPLV